MFKKKYKLLSLLLMAALLAATCVSVLGNISFAVASDDEPLQKLDYDGDTAEFESTSDATPSGTTYLLYAHYGGWWCDAEKTKANTEDDLMCWAAAASNVLTWTEWGKVSGMTNTDQMFAYFQNHWTDEGGLMEFGWTWWFYGYNPYQGVSGWSQVDVAGGNFWPSYTFGSYYHRTATDSQALSAIASYLQAGYGVTLGIYGPGGHAITCWGYNYNPSNPSEYYGLWITDSDDNKNSNSPPDVLHYYEVAYSGGRWYLQNYYGSNAWYIGEVMALEPFPGYPPLADADGPYSGNEGSTVTFDGSGSSDADGDTLQYRWDFDNNGAWDTGWSTSSTAAHTYTDNYAGSAKLQVYDGTFSDTDTASVTISNVAPTANAGADQAVDEGDLVSFSGTYSDPGTSDTHTFVWDFDDGHSASGSQTPTHAYGDNGVYAITLTVTDDDGGVATDTLTITVSNVAPVLDAGDDMSVDEGDMISLSSSGFTDKGTLDIHSATIDWGDGHVEAGVVSEGGGSGTVDGSHVYADNGVYTVTVTVTDDDGGVDLDTFTVTVYNVAPTALIDFLNQGNPQFILPKIHTLTFEGSFTDPGWLDTHTATWDLGDGTIVPGAVSEENDEPDSTGTTTISHVYLTPGTYTVTLTVSDNDGGSDTDTMEVKVVTAEEAKHDIIDYIQGLPDKAFEKNPTLRKKALENMFSAIDKMLDNGAYEEAIEDLLHNIRGKTDGQIDGKPNNDWIVEEDAQYHICMKIDDLIAYLESLL